MVFWFDFFLGEGVNCSIFMKNTWSETHHQGMSLMYHEIKCRIKFQNAISHDFTSTCGVKQIDVLSPTLFNLYINNLVNKGGWLRFQFSVFRLLTDFVCLYNYEFWLSLCKIVRSTVILEQFTPHPQIESNHHVLFWYLFLL
jgi:hypothetical protein